jgi:hypothetical protein
VSLVLFCDRCGNESIRYLTDLRLPSGWEIVIGTTLCDVCAQELHAWLSTTVPRVVKP